MHAENSESLPVLGSILLAEDDENDIILIQRAFTDAGFKGQFHIVRNGGEAIEVLATTLTSTNTYEVQAPKLLLLDLHMGRSGGSQVLEWLRERPAFRATLPVVVLSAIEDPEVITRAYRLGANSYLLKPFNFDTLVDMARQIIAYWFRTNKIAGERRDS